MRTAEHLVAKITLYGKEFLTTAARGLAVGSYGIELVRKLSAAFDARVAGIAAQVECLLLLSHARRDCDLCLKELCAAPHVQLCAPNSDDFSPK
jgi:hypothetical protein